MPVEITLRLEDYTTVTVLPSTVLINGVPVPSATARKPSYGKECYGSGHEALIADFYGCIREGRNFPIDGHEGARVIRLILAAYESASTNKQVKIK